MYSQQHTSIPTKHFGSAISDYHIHNCVCMFELLLWAPALYAFFFFFLRVESSASSARLSSEREELEEKKICFYHDAKNALPHCQNLIVHNLGCRTKPRKDPSWFVQGMLSSCQGSGSSTHRFIMSKLSQFYLISAWRLERRRHTDLAFLGLQHSRDRVAEKFL